MAVDLTGARRSVLGIMEATVRVSRDPEGVDDDVIDPVTLDLVADTADKRNIFSGPALVTGQADGVRVRLPWDTPKVVEGDRVVVIDSADARLRGRVLKVTHVDRGSFLVWRTLECADISAPDVGS